MAKNKTEYRAGDIFAIKISNGQYVFGRILLDIAEQCVRPGLVDRNRSFGILGCLVVEGYDLIKDTPEFEESKVVIKGYMIEDSAFHDGTFQIVGNKTVDPKEMDFPEYLNINTFNGTVAFEKGEVSVPLSLTEEEAEEYSVEGGFHFSTAFDSVILTLIDRSDLTEYVADLKYSDFRFNVPEVREQIYKLAGEDMSLSYYEMALKHGFDTVRFYK